MYTVVTLCVFILLNMDMKRGPNIAIPWLPYTRSEEEDSWISKGLW